MCGQFNMSETANKRLKELAKSYTSFIPEFPVCATVKPSNIVPLLKGKEREYTMGRWGFIPPMNKGLVINARSESINEKRMFKFVAHNRCITACESFCEKDEAGNLYEYRLSDGLIYLGCLWKQRDEMRFTVITRQAHKTKKIHTRVPVVVPESRLSDFLKGAPVEYFEEPDFIVKASQDEQLNMFYLM